LVPNGKQPSDVGSADNKLLIATGSPLEAKSLFKSSYYPDSFIFPYNPDPLCSGNNYDIYDDMFNDDQVKAAISIKTDMVINTGWQIVCDKPEIREYVTNCLKDINTYGGDEATFEDILRDILSSYRYGFSLSEPIYEIVDGKYKYKSIKTRPPHSFQFDLNDKGEVVTIRQIAHGVALEFSPSMFIHHVYQQDFGNPYGRSDLRSAHDAWKAKQFVMRFFAIYLERYASPTVIGKYDENWEPNEIEAFHNLLKTIQNATTLAIPDKALVEFQQLQRDASDAYIKALSYYNMMIARSILVPDLLGLSGGATQGGSYALGKEQFRVFLGTIAKDRESLARKITQKLVRPLVLANFGDVPCAFELVEYSHDDVSEYVRLWTEAVKGRVFKPNPEEINHFRAVTGFPEGPVDMPEPAPAPGRLDPEGNPMPMDPDDKEPMPMKPGMDKAAMDKDDQDEAKNHSLHTFRQKTVYENKVDFTAIARTLATTDSALARALKGAARDIYADFIDQVRDKGLLRRLSPDKINAIEPKFKRPMNAVFARQFRDMFMESMDAARRELFPNGTRRFAERILPEEMLKILDAESFKLVGDYTGVITKKGRNILVEAIKNGIAEGEVVKLLRDAMGDETDKWIATVARTKTTEIYNLARRSYWETDPIASQIVVAYQYSAILDERTSEICADLDGQIFERDLGILRVTPPLHFNCRSVLVPITKFEDYDAKEIPSLDDVKDMGGGLKSFTGKEKP
jgi:SPP1 gp7 family putative phage head morphogenesis protein